MQMVLKHIIVAISLMVSTTAFAQRQKTQKKEINPLVTAYIDSLVASKARIDTAFINEFLNHWMKDMNASLSMTSM